MKHFARNLYLLGCLNGLAAAGITWATETTTVKEGQPGKVIVDGTTSTVDTTKGLTDVENPSPNKTTKVEDCKLLRDPAEVRACEVRMTAEAGKRVKKKTR